MGRVLHQGLEVAGKDWEIVEAVEAVLLHGIEAEVRRLSRYLQAVATIGTIAPLSSISFFSYSSIFCLPPTSWRRRVEMDAIRLDRLMGAVS
jgi:hypothetical protein